MNPFLKLGTHELEQLAHMRQGWLSTAQERSCGTNFVSPNQNMKTLQHVLNTFANRIRCTRLDTTGASLAKGHPRSLRLVTSRGDGHAHTPRSRKFVMNRL